MYMAWFATFGRPMWLGTAIDAFLEKTEVHMKLMKVNAHRPMERSLIQDWFDPFFRADLDAMFDLNSTKPGTSGMRVPANIRETADAFELELAAPGWNKEDFNVRMDGDLLEISAQKTETKKDGAHRQVLQEFQHRSFSRSFSLDDSVDLSQITASYENGLLKVLLPKKPEIKTVQKEIAVQ